MPETKNTRRHYNPVQEDTATFLATSKEGGEYTLIEVEVAPGGGNIPHRHMAHDEHFEAVEGTLEVMVDGKTKSLRSGGRATAPKGALHDFRNPTDGATRFLVEFRPGAAGFEKFLMAGYGLARDGLTTSKGIPRSLYHTAVLLEWSEMRAPGVLTLAGPIFRRLAKRAKRKGIDRDLEAKYCGE